MDKQILKKKLKTVFQRNISICIMILLDIKFVFQVDITFWIVFAVITNILIIMFMFDTICDLLRDLRR